MIKLKPREMKWLALRIHDSWAIEQRLKWPIALHPESSQWTKHEPPTVPTGRLCPSVEPASIEKWNSWNPLQLEVDNLPFKLGIKITGLQRQSLDLITFFTLTYLNSFPCGSGVDRTNDKIDLHGATCLHGNQWWDCGSRVNAWFIWSVA